MDNWKQERDTYNYTVSNSTGDYYPNLYYQEPSYQEASTPYQQIYQPGQVIPYTDPEVLKEIMEKLSKEVHKHFNKDKEVDIMFLYRVYLIYAADRKNPKIVTTGSTIAKDDEDAKVKSGVYLNIDAEWDADYITVVSEKVAEVKVKPKPQEVHQI